MTGLIVVRLRLPAIVVTLAGSFIISGAALVILPRPGGSVPDWLSDLLAGNSPTAFLVLIVVVLLWKLYLATPDRPQPLCRRRESGRRLPLRRAGRCAPASSPMACQGLLAAMRRPVRRGADRLGRPLDRQAFTLNSIAAAVLGGIGFLGGQGTMRGALAGSLLLSLMISVMFLSASRRWRNMSPRA